MFENSKKNRGKLSINFQISILIMILLVLITASVGFVLSGLSLNKQSGVVIAEKMFSTASDKILDNCEEKLEKTNEIGDILKNLSFFNAPIEGDGLDHPSLQFILSTLERNLYIYSIYSGEDNGNFFQVIHAADNESIRKVHDAPFGTIFIVRTITGINENRTQHWSFLDSDRHRISSRIEQTPDYNPSERPWFRISQEAPNEILLTAPYVFNSLKKPGLTTSTAVNTGVSAGIDITLDGVKSLLEESSISGKTGILIRDQNNRVISANSYISSLLNLDEEPLSTLSKQQLKQLEAIQNNSDLLFKEFPWKLNGVDDYTLFICSPISDFAINQNEMQRNILLVSLLIFLVAIPFVIVISRSFSGFLKRLSDDAKRIQNFDYKGRLPEHSNIFEFNELRGAFGSMKETLSDRTEALKDSREKLEYIIELGIAMSVEKNPDKLFEMILKGAKHISHADGGSLYIKNDNDILDFQIVLNDTLNFEQGGTSGNPITLPGVAMFDEAGNPNYHNVVSYACNKCETVVIDNAYEIKKFDLSGTRKFDEMNNYRSLSFLTIPLKLPGSDVLGAVQLLNCKDPETGETIPFDTEIQRFVEALSAEAAAILQNRNLLRIQEQLFESLIQLIANAIDTKSPYTGGHCNRVPVLALQLAEAAEKSNEPGLSDFRFNDTEAKRAFRIGAWLHDAGKITTPEFVVDKSVKLETIYNRIHEIRTRFEVILRDIWLEEKNSILSGADKEEAGEIRRRKEEELYDDFKFIAQCNTGAYNPDPNWKDRLNEISKRSWLGYFDHTIGLSWEEEDALSTQYIPGKPTENCLLSDKQEHIVHNFHDYSSLSEDFNFNLDFPEHQYNRGELYNLSIERGTLTAEERFKITEHTIQTIVMLDKLPLPKNLSCITDYAGNHHETLNGTGYPRKLSDESISIPSRIITIADIFEALTASDRPYKKAKTLSQAVDIMADMQKQSHIDEKLFHLFLKSGVYLDYAKKYLKPEQIDEVDIEQYINLN